MSYKDTEYISKEIQNKLLKYGYNSKIHHSFKSPSVYIKIGKVKTIRVSDHYGNRDSLCDYNIGTHIYRFRRYKNSRYYRHDKINELVKRVIKDLKDIHYKDT